MLFESGAYLFFIVGEFIMADNHYCHVYGGDGVQGFAYALLSQYAVIVHTGGINKHHGTDTEYFHAFFHRVGGSACHRRHYGDILPGEGVDKGAFSLVFSTENSYKYAFGFHNQYL